MRRCPLPTQAVYGRAELDHGIVDPIEHQLLDIDSPEIADHLEYSLVQGPIAHWYLDWFSAELA